MIESFIPALSLVAIMRILPVKPEAWIRILLPVVSGLAMAKALMAALTVTIGVE